MSTAVCQGLQSCLEPRLAEPCVSRHKISPPMSMISQPFGKKQDKEHSRNENNSNGYSDKGGWNFIEALIKPSHHTKQVAEKNEQVYVHPLVKRSSSALSSKGLEMCTESLGCETGSDTSSDEISSFSWEREKMQLSTDEYSFVYSQKSQQQLDEFSSLSLSKNRSTNQKFTKLNTSQHNFPPPLTSISGSDGVQVRPRREGGRLIINAVAVSSSCRTYFEADRTNGRLRLSLLRDCSVDCDCEMNKKDQVVDDKEEQVIEQKNVSELADNEVDEDCWDEDTEGNNTKVGREVPRPSRCKEGGRGGKEMSNWGPLWVAIS